MVLAAGFAKGGKPGTIVQPPFSAGPDTLNAELSTPRRLWNRFCREAVDFVYSRSCVNCREPLPGAGEDFRSGIDEDLPTRFCNGCYELLSCSVERACRRCGAPVGPLLKTENGCRHCRKDRFSFRRVFALGVYEGALHECCVRAKQPFQEPLAAGLAELLWEAHREEWAGLDIDLVVPVPHHWTERVVRRHLPPVTMSRVLARLLMVREALHILTKSRRTPPQSSLTPARRRANLRGVFRTAGGARLNGRTVLLVDDILTTGTTADRAARALQEAGAKQVLVAVLARGIGLLVQPRK